MTSVISFFDLVVDGDVSSGKVTLDAPVPAVLVVADDVVFPVADLVKIF